MGEVMKEAFFSMAHANFAAGDFRYRLLTEILERSLDGYSKSLFFLQQNNYGKCENCIDKG